MSRRGNKPRSKLRRARDAAGLISPSKAAKLLGLTVPELLRIHHAILPVHTVRTPDDRSWRAYRLDEVETYASVVERDRRRYLP